MFYEATFFHYVTCRLFDDAARKLNLTAAVGFYQELCAASSRQLAINYSNRIGVGSVEKSLENRLPATALHLYHLGDALVKFLKSGRPLLHVVRIWTIVAPHLVEVSTLLLLLFLLLLLLLLFIIIIIYCYYFS